MDVSRITRKELETFRLINQEYLIDMIRQLRVVQKFLDQEYPVFSWISLLHGLVADKGTVFCRLYYHNRGEPCLGCPFAFTGPLSWGHASCCTDDGGDRKVVAVMSETRELIVHCSGPYDQPLPEECRKKLSVLLKRYERGLFTLLERFGLPNAYEHPMFDYGGKNESQELV